MDGPLGRNRRGIAARRRSCRTLQFEQFEERRLLRALSPALDLTANFSLPPVAAEIGAASPDAHERTVDHSPRGTNESEVASGATEDRSIVESGPPPHVVAEIAADVSAAVGQRIRQEATSHAETRIAARPGPSETEVTIEATPRAESSPSASDAAREPVIAFEAQVEIDDADDGSADSLEAEVKVEVEDRRRPQRADDPPPRAEKTQQAHEDEQPTASVDFEIEDISDATVIVAPPAFEPLKALNGLVAEDEFAPPEPSPVSPAPPEIAAAPVAAIETPAPAKATPPVTPPTSPAAPRVETPGSRESIAPPRSNSTAPANGGDGFIVQMKRTEDDLVVVGAASVENPSSVQVRLANDGPVKVDVATSGRPAADLWLVWVATQTSQTPAPSATASRSAASPVVTIGAIPRSSSRAVLPVTTPSQIAPASVDSVAVVPLFIGAPETDDSHEEAAAVRAAETNAQPSAATPASPTRHESAPNTNRAAPEAVARTSDVSLAETETDESSSDGLLSQEPESPDEQADVSPESAQAAQPAIDPPVDRQSTSALPSSSQESDETLGFGMATADWAALDRAVQELLDEMEDMGRALGDFLAGVGISPTAAALLAGAAVAGAAEYRRRRRPDRRPNEADWIRLYPDLLGAAPGDES